MQQNMKNQILLTNIQRFSLHDGPGIRTTVFLKGCSLRCPWCSNPENLLSFPQSYCSNGVEGVYGRYYTCEELIRECLKDKVFYEGDLAHPDMWNVKEAFLLKRLPGGVTFSGGECLLQMDPLYQVCEALHKEEVHIAAETCLFCPESDLELAIRFVDLFYVDMKILNAEGCREVEKGDLQQYLNNLDLLMKSGRAVVIRVPVIGGFTDTPENRDSVKKLIEKYRKNILKIELIKEHNLGESKYRSLNLQSSYRGVTDEQMKEYLEELSDLEILTEICKI